MIELRQKDTRLVDHGRISQLGLPWSIELGVHVIIAVPIQYRQFALQIINHAIRHVVRTPFLGSGLFPTTVPMLRMESVATK